MEIRLPITDKTMVESIIPQKKPFVMVDALLEFDETSLTSGFTVPEEHIFVQNNHFQASGVLEHQAQSVALHTGFGFFVKEEVPPVGYIGAVKTFEIKRLPTAGEQLESRVSIISEIMGVTLVKIVTTVSGEQIAHSEMKTVLKQ